jgi:DeoR family transcriptional regulator, suf operon transcriptional repressor
MGLFDTLQSRLSATGISTAPQPSDADLLNLLRSSGSLGVADLSAALDVTPTTVRQRLTRLLAQGMIERHAVRNGRGRPRHRYRTTSKGLRLLGSNFTDLALALWREITKIEDFELRRTMLRRVLRSLVEAYARQIEGNSPAERMQSLAALLGHRRVPFSVGIPHEPGQLPLLTAHACPYPGLAEHDQTICALERALFSELLGQDLQLARCRLNGHAECEFQPFASLPV